LHYARKLYLFKPYYKWQNGFPFQGAILPYILTMA